MTARDWLVFLSALQAAPGSEEPEQRFELLISKLEAAGVHALQAASDVVIIARVDKAMVPVIARDPDVEFVGIKGTMQLLNSDARAFKGINPHSCTHLDFRNFS